VVNDAFTVKFDFKVFLSHTNTREDMEMVSMFSDQLKEVGINCYVAEDDPQPGQLLSEKVKKNIDDSDVVVGIWTSNSKNSVFMNQELGYAERTKAVMLLAQTGSSPCGFFTGREYIVFDPENPLGGITRAMNYINALLDDKARTVLAKAQQEQVIAALIILVVIIAIVVLLVLLTGSG
jgi:hypothetical protein